MNRLSIELVPRSAWFQNLRSMLQPGQWDRLRRSTYRRAEYACEICGGTGPEHPVECHEKWEYDDKRYVATLVGLYGLCPACHEVKHIGLAKKRGRLDQARTHLSAVNETTLAQADKDIDAAFYKWRQRSEHQWTVNIDWALEATDETP